MEGKGKCLKNYTRQNIVYIMRGRKGGRMVKKEHKYRVYEQSITESTHV
jgi:hypothetical protein